MPPVPTQTDPAAVASNGETNSATIGYGEESAEASPHSNSLHNRSGHREHGDRGFSRQVSASEAAEKSGTGLTAPAYLRWIEIPFRVTDSVTGLQLPEATGWGMDSAGRGPLNQVGSYVGAGILRLATVEAQGGKVKGFKPSSLLTLFTSVIGVIAALSMPIVGAVVDHTHYRRMMGVISGILSVAFIGGQIAISENNWFTILVIDACQTLVYLVHTTSVFAYLPDLSLDQDVIANYTSQFNIRQYCGQFVFVSLVIISGEARGADRTVESTVQTAKDAAGIAFGFGSLLIGYAWLFLFRDRPALSKVPEGSTLVTTGFVQVGKTARIIIANYRALKWFMISLLWSPEAGAGVVLSIAVTLLTITIKLSAHEIAITSLMLMIGNLAGSLFSKKVCALINPLNSYRMGMMCLGTLIACATLYLDGPRKVKESYLTALGWGVAMGWTYPSQRVLFCTLIPKGQETEMMGLFVFVGQILGWLPSLLFTIMNEKGVPLQYGLTLVGGFCVAAVVFTLPMGNYDEACRQASVASEQKLTAVVHATAHNQAVADEKLESLEEENGKASTAMTLSGTEESAPKITEEDSALKTEDVEA